MISENEKCSEVNSAGNWKLRTFVANNKFYENADSEVKPTIDSRMKTQEYIRSGKTTGKRKH